MIRGSERSQGRGGLKDEVYIKNVARNKRAYGPGIDPELPVEQQYAPSHEVQVEEGGLLSALLPECSNFWVNSLHGQGAKVVSPRLRVEARSPDGLVEAVSVINHPFALGVQWHPEWNSSEYALSRILFEGFITACQHHIAEKQRL